MSNRVSPELEDISDVSDTTSPPNKNTVIESDTAKLMSSSAQVHAIEMSSRPKTAKSDEFVIGGKRLYNHLRAALTTVVSMVATLEAELGASDRGTGDGRGIM